jgi:hypothetical protein
MTKTHSTFPYPYCTVRYHTFVALKIEKQRLYRSYKVPSQRYAHAQVGDSSPSYYWTSEFQ